MKYSSIAAALLIPALLAGCSVRIDSSGINASSCSHSQTYSDAFPADGLKTLRVAAWAGDLNIRAVDGLTEVKVEAKACASDNRILETLGMKAEQSGDLVRVDVLHPTGITTGSGWVDVTIDAPASLVAEISDTSGSTLIDGLAAVEISASSGDLKIQRIGGTTEIRKKSSGSIVMEQLDGDLILGDIGSGDLTVSEVAGDFSLSEKSSGTVVLSDISGKVQLGRLGSGDLRVLRADGGLTLQEKSSGSILVEQAGDHVVMAKVGSGDLTVNGVQGDLVVAKKSSGSVRTSNVTGKVDVPND